MKIDNMNISESLREEYLKIASKVISTLEMIDKKKKEDEEKNAQIRDYLKKYKKMVKCADIY